MQACVRLDDRVYSGWFAVEQGLRQMYVLAPLLLNILFAAVINVAYTCFKEDKDITNTLVHPRKNKGAGGGAEESNYQRASTGEANLRRPLCCNAGRKQLRKIMGLIGIVCAAFGLTV